MNTPQHDRPFRSPGRGLAPKIRAALALLAEAYDYARDTQCDAWDYAVEIGTLETVGLLPNDFRWLLRKGYVQHARETTTFGSSAREFGPPSGSTFGKGSCFVLTDAGLNLARRVAQVPSAASAADSSADYQLDGRHVPPRPHWDAALRELRVAGQVIKCFKSLAANQERILTAFEEEGWPRRIDDPLPPTPDKGQDPKRRLNDTVKGLNRNQHDRQIRFACDGTGQGVRWDWVDGGFSDEDDERT